jgi:hypothetical protein
MDPWNKWLTFVIALAAVGQFLVAWAVYVLQRSNEEVANRIEVFVRLTLISNYPDIFKLEISNLSSFGIWIDYAEVRVRTSLDDNLVETVVPMQTVVDSCETIDRQISGLPICGFTVDQYTVCLWARGKRRIALTNAGGTISIQPTGFGKIRTIVRRMVAKVPGIVA